MLTDTMSACVASQGAIVVGCGAYVSGVPEGGGESCAGAKAAETREHQIVAHPMCDPG